MSVSTNKISIYVLLLLLMTPTSAEPLTFPCRLGPGSRDDPMLMVELTEASTKAAGHQIKFVEYPWVRVISMLKYGKVTGSHCLSLSEERKSWVHYLKIPFIVGFAN